jgi:hypothetical protein
MSDPRTGESPIYVSAFFCDRLLTEADGVLSAIRLVDIFSAMVPEEGAKQFVPRLETNLVLIFRSDSQAEFTATIHMKDPRGTVKSSTIPVTLSGQSGVYVYTMYIVLVINGAIEGTNWFDISVNGSLANRLALVVRHQPVPTERQLRQI